MAYLPFTSVREVKRMGSQTMMPIDPGAYSEGWEHYRERTFRKILLIHLQPR